MIVGLLGGTFNPPHLGHFSMAQQVLDFTECEEVWLVPGFRHTFQKPSAPVEDRLKMTQLLVQRSVSCHPAPDAGSLRNQETSVENTIKSKNEICVSSLEIDHELDGNTIHLLQFLPKEHEYRFIIGSDQLPTFHLWGDWQQLLRQMQFLVFPRYGYPNEPLYPGMRMVNDESLIVSNISSTKVRERIRRGLSVVEFVGKDVSSYIQQHNLYK